MTKEKYLTIAQASSYTGLSHRTIQRYIASGKLPSRKNASGVRHIPEKFLKCYVKAEHSNNRAEQGIVREVLLQMLDLLPTSDIATLTKKQKLRKIISALVS
ncbi:MAG: helix-turn-helix domain-containing protein [Aliidiomarina sp.]|uniref:helix-turn-helix domain-containing protein n=1 Tax=Aliidiomarina sp. TaxID=1872439 RepID=UPI00345BB811|nr:helix-turn-helix domain-containing protein [Aliidiomarina sp.]